VGSGTSSDGNNNLLCGTVEDYGDWGRKSRQRTVTCGERLWGRHIILRRPTKNTTTSTVSLKICEVEIYNDLAVGILYNQSNVSRVYVDEGSSLPRTLVCGVNPDTIGYNAALRLNWRRANGSLISTQANPTHTITQKSGDRQELYVKNVSVEDEGLYVCEYTLPDNNQTKNESVEILVNVDCGWSAWSDCSFSCGIGSRNRSADSPKRRHYGKPCTGPSVENCINVLQCIGQIV
jgi:hypothetical protein